MQSTERQSLYMSVVSFIFYIAQIIVNAVGFLVILSPYVIVSQLFQNLPDMYLLGIFLFQVFLFTQLVPILLEWTKQTQQNFFSESS